MDSQNLNTTSMNALVERMQNGDSEAQDLLLRRVAGRLERLARKMLRSFPAVGRWEQTDDVLQNALVRLLRSLRELKPENTRAFFGLATVHMRRELIDLNRHYQGAHGLGKKQAVRDFATPDDSQKIVDEPADAGPSAEQLERWQAFHEAVEELPVEQREVVGLAFYHGWTHAQIADLFQVSERTVRRYWQSACLSLNDRLGGDLPLD